MKMKIDRKLKMAEFCLNMSFLILAFNGITSLIEGKPYNGISVLLFAVAYWLLTPTVLEAMRIIHDSRKDGEKKESLAENERSL